MRLERTWLQATARALRSVIVYGICLAIGNTISKLFSFFLFFFFFFFLFFFYCGCGLGKKRIYRIRHISNELTLSLGARQARQSVSVIDLRKPLTRQIYLLSGLYCSDIRWEGGREGGGEDEAQWCSGLSYSAFGLMYRSPSVIVFNSDLIWFHIFYPWLLLFFVCFFFVFFVCFFVFCFFVGFLFGGVVFFLLCVCWVFVVVFL